MKAKKIAGITLLLLILTLGGYALGHYIGKACVNNNIGINSNLNKVLSTNATLNDGKDNNKSNSNKDTVTRVTKVKGKKEDSDSKKSIDYSKEINGLVVVSNYDNSFVIDLRYATENNFTGKPVYKTNVCALQKNTLSKLIAANDEFKALGYKIKIWDGYRPADVQKYFWSIVKDRRYIASPYVNGSRHNRGTAVDITLVDSKGNELEMPTGFDQFNTSAHRDNANISEAAKNNLILLTEVMKKHGFTTIETEWWHYDDEDSNKYPILNIPLEAFLKEEN